MRQQQSLPATPTQKNAQPSMDDMDDMEMDDAIGPMDPVDTPPANQRPVQPAQQSMFGQQQRQNNLTNTSGILHQGLRTSQPSTPSASGFGFQNNPTVSSVNTPTLSAQPQQTNSRFTPDNSIPGTPSEMDEDFSTLHMDMSSNNLGAMNNMNGMNFPYGFGNDLGLDLCIDEPAKRLFSPNGGGLGNQRALQQQFAQFGLGNGQFGSNDDLVRRLRQQQMMHMQGYGAAGAAMMMGEEHKPFRCPVIGCEKAYKNQNGLK